MPDKHYELSKKTRVLLELTGWFHDLYPLDLCNSRSKLPVVTVFVLNPLYRRPRTLMFLVPLL